MSKSRDVAVKEHGRVAILFMFGSEQFQMMEGVSESLAGRFGLLALPGYSLREKLNVAFDHPLFLRMCAKPVRKAAEKHHA